MRLSGTLTVGDIRDAVRELRDFSLEELRRLLAGYSRAHKAGDTTDTGILTAKVGFLFVSLFSQLMLHKMRN
jgi:hypothetical protein